MPVSAKENMSEKKCQWCENTDNNEIQTQIYLDSYHQDGTKVALTMCKNSDACRERARKNRERYLAQRRLEMEKA